MDLGDLGHLVVGLPEVDRPDQLVEEHPNLHRHHPLEEF